MGLFKKIFGKRTKDKFLLSRNEKNKNAINIGNVVTFTNTTNLKIPTLQGDYAKAVFLNAYQKSSPVKADTEYQQYLIYECGIRKPSEYHLELTKDGYLKKSSTADRIKGLKIAELKVILSELDQKTAGKKDVLVQRIIEVADDETIMRWWPDDYYSISEKGKVFLERNTDYVKIHKHKNWDIDWKDYDTIRKAGCNFYDIVWSIFNERLLQSQNYGRNEYFNMYQLLAEEGRRKDALEKLLMVLFNDVSGVEGNCVYSLYKDGVYTKKEAMDDFDVAIMLAPGIVGSFKEYEDVFTDDMVERIYDVYKLPLQLCDKKLFLEIVHSALSNTYDEEKIKQKLKREYKKFTESIFK
jgi:hypothetical protein